MKKGSSIRYKEDFHNFRLVELEGQTFFEVVKARCKEFNVITGDTKIKILGTTFSVAEKKKNAYVKIVLHTGLLAMSVKGVERSWTIIPKKKFMHKEGKISIEKYHNSLSIRIGEECLDVNSIKLGKLLNFLNRRLDYEFGPHDYHKLRRLNLGIRNS